MPYIFDLLYREYCRARLVEMREQLLLVSPRTHSEAKAVLDAKDAVGRPPTQTAEVWRRPNRRRMKIGRSGAER